MAETIRELLDVDPPRSGDRALQEVMNGFIGQDLGDTIDDLRHELAHGSLDLEGYRRLHVLISHLYHKCGATIEQTRALRDEVNAKLRDRSAAEIRKEVDPHVVLEP